MARNALEKGLTVLLSCLCWIARSQTADMRITVWTDNAAYLSRQDVWVEGRIAGTTRESEIIGIRLIDRNGATKSERMLRTEGRRFLGYLTVPDNLKSDYYFIDVHAAGASTSTGLVPVMVINPRFPPERGCPESPVRTPPKSATTAPSALSVTPARTGPRQEARVEWGTGNNATDASLSISREDRLTQRVREDAAGFHASRRHAPTPTGMEDGHLARVRVSAKGRPLPGIGVLASVRGNVSEVAGAVSNKEGIAVLKLPPTYEAGGLVISAVEPSEKELSLELLPDAAENIPVDFPCLRLDSTFKTDIEDRMLHAALAERFQPGGLRSYFMTDTDTSDFYGKPDQRYILDDYVRFPSMEEVLAEFITQVRVKKDPSSTLLQVLNAPFKTFFSEQGLILVDGVPFKDAESVLAIDPLRIRCIDVVSRNFRSGDIVWKGIVHLKSYRRDMGGASLPAKLLLTDFTGLQTPAMPSDLQRPSPENRIPETRATLHFGPLPTEAKVDGNRFAFQTSDAYGEYRIVLRRFRQDGVMETAETSIFVGDAPQK